MRPALRDGYQITYRGGSFFYRTSTEAEIRDVIAAFADLAGFEVQTEVTITGWGRVDVFLMNGVRLYAVEVKKEVRTARQIRLAVQQAHSYAQALARDLDMHVQPMLVARDLDEDAVDRSVAGTTYSDVTVYSLNDFIGWLMLPDANRAAAALNRLAEARSEFVLRSAMAETIAAKPAVQHPDEVFAELVAEFEAA